VAFGDFVEEFAVADGGDAGRSGKVRRECAVLARFRAVPFATLAVAVGAVVLIDGECRAEIVSRGLERVRAMLGFVWDDPLARLESCVDDGDEDESENRGEEEFANFGGHSPREIFA
jgi:hypothetical protein